MRLRQAFQHLLPTVQKQLMGISNSCAIGIVSSLSFSSTYYFFYFVSPKLRSSQLWTCFVSFSFNDSKCRIEIHRLRGKRLTCLFCQRFCISTMSMLKSASTFSWPVLHTESFLYGWARKPQKQKHCQVQHTHFFFMICTGGCRTQWVRKGHELISREPIHREAIRMNLLKLFLLTASTASKGRNPISINSLHISDRLNWFKSFTSTASPGFKTSPELFNVVSVSSVNIWMYPTRDNSLPSPFSFHTTLLFLEHITSIFLPSYTSKDILYSTGWCTPASSSQQCPGRRYTSLFTIAECTCLNRNSIGFSLYNTPCTHFQIPFSFSLYYTPLPRRACDFMAARPTLHKLCNRLQAKLPSLHWTETRFSALQAPKDEQRANWHSP